MNVFSRQQINNHNNCRGDDDLVSSASRRSWRQQNNLRKISLQFRVSHFLFLLVVFLSVWCGGIVSATTYSSTKFAGLGIDIRYSQSFMPITCYSMPTLVAGDSDGNIYIYDANEYRINKVSSTGILSMLIGSLLENNPIIEYADNFAATSFAIPNILGMYVDKLGNIYFSDYDHFVIRKYTKSTGIINTIAGSYTDTGPAPAPIGSPNIAATSVAISPYVLWFDEINNILYGFDGSVAIILV